MGAVSVLASTGYTAEAIPCTVGEPLYRVKGYEALATVNEDSKGWRVIRLFDPKHGYIYFFIRDREEESLVRARGPYIEIGDMMSLSEWASNDDGCKKFLASHKNLGTAIVCPTRRPGSPERQLTILRYGSTINGIAAPPPPRSSRVDFSGNGMIMCGQ